MIFESFARLKSFYKGCTTCCKSFVRYLYTCYTIFVQDSCVDCKTIVGFCVTIHLAQLARNPTIVSRYYMCHATLCRPLGWWGCCFVAGHSDAQNLEPYTTVK